MERRGKGSEGVEGELESAKLQIFRDFGPFWLSQKQQQISMNFDFLKISKLPKIRAISPNLRMPENAKLQESKSRNPQNRSKPHKTQDPNPKQFL